MNNILPLHRINEVGQLFFDLDTCVFCAIDGVVAIDLHSLIKPSDLLRLEFVLTCIATENCNINELKAEYRTEQGKN